MNSDILWLTLGAVLVLEGLLPSISPAAWRRMFHQILQLKDGQIRFMALGSVCVGLLLLWMLAF